MAKKVTQEEYDNLRGKYEEKYGYDNMSDEQKEQFDKTFNDIVTVDDNADDTEEEDNIDKGQEREIGDNRHSRDDDDEDIR